MFFEFHWFFNELVLRIKDIRESRPVNIVLEAFEAP
jgi:hypothetical protein